MRSLLLFLSLLVSSIVTVEADITKPVLQNKQPGTVFDYDTALNFSQSAINRQVENINFINADGSSVSLSDFHGKPLVISMVYTSCYQICPMTTRYLSKVVDKARQTLGDDSFEVAVIGFDTEFDTPSAMQYFGNKQGLAGKNWHLLSIPGGRPDSFAKDIGFLFEPTSNGFDHLIQATILDAEGQVYRQVYGQVFDTPLLVDPLIELVLGRGAPEGSLFSDLGNRIKLFCTTYDPVRDGYYFDYSLFIGMIIGGSIISYTAFVAMRELRKS